MAIYIFFKKTFKQSIRQKSSLILIILFPVIFISFFAFIFGGSNNSTQTYTIGVINNDSGFGSYASVFSNDTLISQNQSEIVQNGFASYFIAKLGELRYNDSQNIPVFDLNTYLTEKDAKKPLEERNIDALLVFDENFSLSLISAINNKNFFLSKTWIPTVPRNINSTLLLKGDSYYQNFQNVQKVISQQLQLLKEDFVEIKSINKQSIAGVISSKDISVSTIEQNNFEYMIPGFLVFGLMLTISIIAGSLVRENETKTIERIRLARTSGLDLLLGVTINQTILATLQIILMVVTASFFGFKSQGSLLSIGVVLFLTEFFILGLGLLIASFVQKADSADTLGSIIAAPVGFVSGSFIPLPHIDLVLNVIPVAGGGKRALELWDLVPTTHAVTAVRNISSYGFTLQDNLFGLAIIASAGIVLFIVSIISYSMRQLKGF